ncbi:hypothetical protein HZ326_3142 [Fusarium oxysporum f. sp. albedinis]|nr:hypothetical protein HZ326_3142 [Fusarium oxysporum f. sp. albedinis]
MSQFNDEPKFVVIEGFVILNWAYCCCQTHPPPKSAYADGIVVREDYKGLADRRSKRPNTEHAMEDTEQACRR